MMSLRRYPETPIPSVAAVVVGPKGALLKRRDKPPYKGLWNILSGVIKTGETQKEAIVREVREETGINADVIRFVDTSDVIITDSDGRVEYHFTVNVYLLQASSHDMHFPEGNADIRWFHPDSIPIEDMPVDVSKALQAMRDGGGQAAPPHETFLQVSAGSVHTCGVKSDGTVTCWGDDWDNRATPPTGTFTQLSAGQRHTCGVLTDATMACWGANEYGQATPPAGAFSQVSAGRDHTCGVRTDGTIDCWGGDFYGQATPPDGTFLQLSAGTSHICGVRTDHTLACWGAHASTSGVVTRYLKRGWRPTRILLA